jgi:outer membrane protein OmpA-like peptidoglycan-associated protein
VVQAPVAREPVPPVQKRIVLRGVHFDFDKATIRKEARPILDEAIATLQREGTVSVVAEGHTDSRGSDTYNQTLSLRRATAVRDYLVAGGIGSSRIQVQGFGESRPVASNDTDDGRAQNRRVELRVR